MGPSRTSKSVYKRSNKEASPEKELRNSSKTKPRKKRLTDKLGPQWTKVELERFYEAYRKHGRDWKKVAAVVRNNRSVDMVEALFNMNRAYLSLPEGTASVVGLIAMMTDHYSVIEESESEEEEEEEEEEEGHGASVKYQKRKLAQLSSSDFRQEVIPPHSVASAGGCLPFLKLTQAYGIERRAAGKRTPRFPVPSEYEREDREVSMPPSKRAKKQLDADDDDTLALAMANAARRGEESQYRRAEVNGNTSNGKMSQAKEAQSKHGASSMVRNVVRIRRDRRHIKAAPGGALLVNTEGVGTVEVPQKGKNVRREEAEGAASNDSGEAGSANEGFKSGDEFEALQALAALSGLLSPDGLTESESNPQLKEDIIANNVDEKPHTPETFVRSYQRRKSKQAGPEDSLPHAISPANTRKPKSAQETIDANAGFVEEAGTLKRKRKTLHDKESAKDDDLKTMFKARRADQSPPKKLRTAKTAEESSSPSDKKITEPDAVVSATQVSGPGPASLPQRPPNRRKMSLKKSLRERAKISETTHEKPHSCKKELLKEQVSTCLSCPLVRRRCIYEWFYSAIDYPWFAKMEFIDFLNHLGIGTPRLTRLEWSVIKSSLGRTRRFSEKFIQEERDKLKQYRESARKHYTELRAGAREVLPRDFAQPLSVGNRVIAIHPKTREVRDGKILTVDHNKCNVLFDDLGADMVMDIDIMPLNPLEYMPDGLMRQIESKEAELNRQPSSDKSALFPPPVLENIDFSMVPPKKQDDRDKRVTTDQSYNIANDNARQGENQRALMLEYASDAEEMGPEMLGIVSGSRSIAQAMVDAAMKAASLVKDDKDKRNVVLQALDSIVSGLKHQGQTNGSFDHHHQSWSPSNTEGLMTSELIASCLSTWLMIQRCTEKQYPPADIAQVMEIAVRSLEPRCPQNMPIYRDIQTCMGWITNQIMCLVKPMKI
ncbi:protein ALWAYS EARLY 1-like [Brassica napus]|uniref:protein ALWAYS EARLY 1-like n=1 Tax=Brassica napus TaxID=3708 RepID=UPI0004EDAD9F|nr:protein ALWAYS EARLY 1-like [Brassica napus]